MIEAFDRAHCNGALQQNMRTQHVGLGEVVRIPKAQINVGMGSKMEDGVDIVLSQAPQHIFIACHIAMEELEVGSAFEHPRIVQGAAVIELVKGDDIVLWVLDHQMSDQPRRYKAFPSGDQDVLNIWKRPAATLAGEDGRFTP